jgi:hypothetical protein
VEGGDRDDVGDIENEDEALERLIGLVCRGKDDRRWEEMEWMEAFEFRRALDRGFSAVFHELVLVLLEVEALLPLAAALLVGFVAAIGDLEILY